MLLHLLFPFLFVTLTNPVSSTSITERIVGGSEVKITDVPYQVALLCHGVFRGCGGSVIHPLFAITAAHCVRSNGKAFSVRVGSIYTNKHGVVHDVLSVIIHPKFNYKAMDYDFGLLELTTKIEFGKNVRPLQIEPKLLPAGTMLSTTGWGQTCSLKEVPTKLRSVKVPLVDDEVCLEYYDAFTASMVCAGYGDRKVDASNGDSGGPLVYKNTLIGITSFGPGCDEGNCPGVYAKVSVAYPWIVQNIQSVENKQKYKNIKLEKK